MTASKAAGHASACRRFVERLARAITAGDESPQGAAGLARVR
jgi:hypothetical protein